MDSPIEKETYSLLERDFELPELKEKFDEEKAISILERAIKILLDRDFERLLQICYRVDLKEEILRKILHETPPDEISGDLARSLWERQKMKIEIRRRYS